MTEWITVGTVLAVSLLIVGQVSTPLDPTGGLIDAAGKVGAPAIMGVILLVIVIRTVPQCLATIKEVATVFAATVKEIVDKNDERARARDADFVAAIKDNSEALRSIEKNCAVASAKRRAE